jgi:hypothetical protein
MCAGIAGKGQQFPNPAQLDAGWQFDCFQWFR